MSTEGLATHLFATLVTTAMIFGFGGLLIRTLGHAL